MNVVGMVGDQCGPGNLYISAHRIFPRPFEYTVPCGCGLRAGRRMGY